MATYKAINNISKALQAYLESRRSSLDIGSGVSFEVKVFNANSFVEATGAITTGVSIFLYRVTSNGNFRIPDGRRVNGLGQQDTQLPIDLHYLFTVWADDASMQNLIAGWMMRVLEDESVLPFALLDDQDADVFQPHENAEIILNDLSNEDLFRLSDLLLKNGYRLTIPYIVRNVHIESARFQHEGGPVHRRVVDFQNV